MSETFEEKLDELRKKHPGSITEGNRAFLTARRSYLQPHELESFGIVEPETEGQPEDDELIPETEEGNEPPKLPKRSKAKAKTKDEPEE